MATWSFVSSIGFWEFLEYFFEGAVIVGCVGEALGEFTNFLNINDNQVKKDCLLKISTIILLFGLAGALASTVRTNALAGKAIDQLDKKAKHALDDSDRAVENSGKAINAAHSAADAATKAVGEAADAQTLATGARQKADSFEKKIVTAEADASKALARISEAVVKAETAADKADQIAARMADRELTDWQVKSIADALAKFAGQEYTIMTYFDMREPLKIANRIHEALQRANWRYTVHEPGGMLGGATGGKIYRHPDASKSTRDAADSLARELNQKGVDAQLVIESPTSNPKHNKISLNIGTKPQ